MLLRVRKPIRPFNDEPRLLRIRSRAIHFTENQNIPIQNHLDIGGPGAYRTHSAFEALLGYAWS